MQDLVLPKRMKEIINLVPNCTTVLDVGCDHGKILLGLLKSNKCKYGIGSDISEPSALKTIKLMHERNIKNCEVVVGYGLSVIQDRTNVDTVIIAGMGGYEIVKILSNGKKNYSHLVLNPMNDVDLVRKYLVKNRYEIIKDYMIEDKSKFYDLILARVGGKTRYRKINYIFGKNNINNLDFVKYVKLNKKLYTKALQNANGKNKRILKKKIRYLNKILLYR